ncbi:hypothetical protein V6N13_138422 [Hibiscus sabdariffa]|uniref:Uncharacterized protein n=1 Tax=Hibiscus sabdariffa TaxID=183260 RepID=A0ABR2QDE0_9ROSI
MQLTVVAFFLAIVSQARSKPPLVEIYRLPPWRARGSFDEAYWPCTVEISSGFSPTPPCPGRPRVVVHDKYPFAL